MNEEDPILKKRSQNLDFAKFLLGTVVLGVVSLVINHTIQEKKIDLELNRNEAEHLGKFVGQYLSLTNLDQKKEFLEFMITISYTDPTRSRYSTLLDSVNKKMEKKKQLEEQIMALEKQISNEMAQQVQSIEKEIVNSQSSPATAEVSQRIEQLDEIIRQDQRLGKIQELNLAVSALDKSYQTIRETPKKEGFQLIEEKEDWLKEGYFRTYGGNYLAVNNLENRSRIVSFQLRTRKEFNSGVISNFELSPGEKTIIDHADHQYEIILQRIGAAGRYPLPKAAIYSVRIFKRSA